jgi:autoinducer 2-degrading protein
VHVTLVHVHVVARHIEAFVAATRANHEASRTEPGNLRFDVLQRDDDRTRFVLVEVYRDAEAAAAHKQTPHYMAWRDAVAPMMAAPREGVRFRVVAPDDPERW